MKARDFEAWSLKEVSIVNFTVKLSTKIITEKMFNKCRS